MARDDFNEAEKALKEADDQIGLVKSVNRPCSLSLCKLWCVVMSTVLSYSLIASQKY